jgi:hypothetical protein
MSPTEMFPEIRRRAKKSLVAAVILTALAVSGVATGTGLLVGAATTPVAEQVTVTAREQGVHEEYQGGRRSKRLVDVRHVVVELPDGSTGQLDSDDIQVGETVDVWQYVEDGRLTESEPRRVGFGDVLLDGFLILAGLGLAVAAVGSLRKYRGLSRAELAGSPRIVYAIDRGATKAINEKVWQIGLRVQESDHPRIKVGRTESLLTDKDEMPIDPAVDLPEAFEGKVLYRGRAFTVVALRSGPEQPWWITEV